MIHACASPWWRHAAAALIVACGGGVAGAVPLAGVDARTVDDFRAAGAVRITPRRVSRGV